MVIAHFLFDRFSLLDGSAAKGEERLLLPRAGAHVGSESRTFLSHRAQKKAGVESSKSCGD